VSAVQDVICGWGTWTGAGLAGFCLASGPRREDPGGDRHQSGAAPALARRDPRFVGVANHSSRTPSLPSPPRQGSGTCPVWDWRRRCPSSRSPWPTLPSWSLVRCP